MLKSKIFIIFLLFVLSSCGHIKTRDDLKKDKTETQVEQEQAEDAAEEVIGDFQPPVVKLPKVGLILGPGGMKSFAHSGVIKALLDKKINIDYIVGFEWGALIANYYAQSAKIHEVEWQLYKLGKDDLIKRSFIKNEIESFSVSEQLNKLLNQNQKQKSISNYEVPFACATQSIVSGQVNWLTSGNTKSALQKCMTFPPNHNLSAGWVSASFELEKAIDFLKSKGMELIIVVDVLKRGGNLLNSKDIQSHPTSAVLWQQVRSSWSKKTNRAGVEWIHVNTRQYDLFSQSRKLIIMAGDQEGRKASEIIAEKYGF